MARKKKDQPLQNATIIIPPPPPELLQNGLSDALGFGQGPFGLPGFGGGSNSFPGGFTAQPVESSNTLFDNLRWYMVSNMRQLLSQMYVEIGLVKTIVDVPVDDGLRGGILIKSKQLDEDQIKELQISMDRDDDLNTVGWAAKWNRLYGGAGILILVDDQDPEEPLDIKSITENTDLEFRAVDMWELFWDKQNTEGYDPQLQQQDFEHYDYYAENVHKTRVMRLKGPMAPSFIRPRLRGWGVSVVENLVRSLNQYLKSTDLSFEVLDEFKLDVYKIKNLVNTLLQPGGSNKVKERVQMANWQKNYQNAIVMDSEDDFDHKQLSFAGLAEAQTGIRMQVAADMRMPITKLFGTSVSSGFQTDQNDMENYNSMVESEVRNKLKYDILRLLEIKCQKMFGMIPEDLEIEFKPLRELTAVDQETVKTQKFTRLIQAKTAGELSTQEFRDACNKGNLFDVQLDTVEDGFNPDDENDASEEDDDDKDNPGANRIDTKKVSAGTPTDKPPKKQNKVVNSPEFDKASYEADGGDAWISQQRLKGLLQLSHITNGPLWEKSKEASRKSFGEIKWPFVMWMYKKLGGRI